MGIRILEGTYDGTDPAAFMVDSVREVAIGPLWKGVEAAEQIEAFVDWMSKEPWLRDETFAALDLDRDEIPDPLADAHDPRAWPPAGLKKLRRYWTEKFVDENGLLREQPVAS